jgi:predicted transcriptional regulator
MLSERAVFSVSRPTRDRDLAEVRAWIEAERGRSVAWHEVIEYLYRYWKDTEMSRP